MIVVFFGQPASGKTTLAKALQERIYTDKNLFVGILDGDEVRSVFNDVDYSRGGRLINSRRIGDIAHFLAEKSGLLIVSAVYPYSSSRLHLQNLHDSVLWVDLHYSGGRDKEQFLVADFEEPTELNRVLTLNTSEKSVIECIDIVVNNLHSSWLP